MTNPTPLSQTDQYKLTMASAGYPLRKERFYYSHRKGGKQFNPIDIEAWIRDHLPRDDRSLDFNPVIRDAILHSDIQVNAVPQGSYFDDRDPIFSVEGASALVSWLEPTVLRLSHVFQIATMAIHDRDKLIHLCSKATCEAERDQVWDIQDRVGSPRIPIEVHSEEYYGDVYNRVRQLVDIVGDPDRLFEVGMRATSCEEQHAIAVYACKNAGVMRTSNAHLAQMYDMQAVGTMGHEHIQRFGSSYDAFTTMRDRTLGYVSYLLDTYNTIQEGIPSAIRTILESPDRRQGLRFDSESGIREQYLFAIQACRKAGIQPDLILESGWNDVLTREFEALRIQNNWPAEHQSYGIGGYIVKTLWPSLSRDAVSAVYKLSESNGVPNMKFGDEPGGGKESIPGSFHIVPSPFSNGPSRFVVQDHENWIPVEDFQGTVVGTMGYSPETSRLVQSLYAKRSGYIHSVS